MKIMAEKGGLDEKRRLTKHSVRNLNNDLDIEPQQRPSDSYYATTGPQKRSKHQ